MNLKYFTLVAIYLLFCILGNSIAQSSFYSYPFESGGYTNLQCFATWSTAGSATYKNTRNPYKIINAITDIGLKTDGSDCSILLIEAIQNIKMEHSNELIVVFFPPGTYVFNDKIEMKSFTDNGTTYYSMNNVILKGSDTSPGSILQFNHNNYGIYIKGSQKIGIEDLILHRTTDATSGSNIGFENSSDCWVAGVSSYEAYQFHVEFKSSESTATSGVHNITITGSLFNDALAHGDGGQGYGVQLDGAYNCLVDNCIFRRLRHSINFQQNASFNVVAYNASYDPFWTFQIYDGIFENPIPPPDLNFHGRFKTDPGPHHNLSEGNRVEQVKFDLVHGSNGPHNTFFRTDVHISFDIKTTDKPEKLGYPYNEYNQKHQNIIGVSGVSVQDKITIYGTINYCNDLLKINDEPSDMATNITSYYTWNQKPDYMSLYPWPYIPGITINAAEARSTTALLEQWTKYSCGGQLALNLFFNNSSNVSSGSYKALQTIIAESLTINSGSSVEFRAPVSITLVKDFEVKPGAEFIITPESNNCPE